MGQSLCYDRDGDFSASSPEDIFASVRAAGCAIRPPLFLHSFKQLWNDSLWINNLSSQRKLPCSLSPTEWSVYGCGSLSFPHLSMLMLVVSCQWPLPMTTAGRILLNSSIFWNTALLLNATSTLLNATKGNDNDGQMLSIHSTFSQRKHAYLYLVGSPLWGFESFPVRNHLSVTSCISPL